MSHKAPLYQHSVSHATHRSLAHSTVSHSRRSVHADSEAAAIDVRSPVREADDRTPTIGDMVEADKPHPHMQKKFATSYTSLLLPIVLFVGLLLIVAFINRLSEWLSHTFLTPTAVIMSPKIFPNAALADPAVSLSYALSPTTPSSQLPLTLLPSPLDPSQLVHPDVAYLIGQAHGVAPYIPDIIHFVVGVTHTSTHQPTTTTAADFQLQHWLAIKSARDSLQPQHIYCHVAAPEPVSQWWQKAKALCTQLLPVRSLTHVFGRPIHHAQQKSDFLRLEALLQYGGVALDLDVLTVGSWKADVTQYQICFQQDFLVGLTQSAKLNWADRFDTSFVAAKKDSPLLREWYGAYRMFSDRAEVAYSGTDESGDSWTVYDDHVTSFSATLLWTLNTLRPHLLTQLQPSVIGLPYANEPEGIQRLYGDEASDAAAGWTVHLWQGEHEKRREVRGKDGTVRAVSVVLDKDVDGKYAVDGVQQVCALAGKSRYGRLLKQAMESGGDGEKCT